MTMIDPTMVNEVEVEASDAEMEVDMSSRFTPRQLLQAEYSETVVEIFGQYDQSTGSDGAHYALASPYVSEGLVCSNCKFYEGPRCCELVSGDIDPSGICKLWIIPADLIVEDAMPARSIRTPVEARESHGRTVEFRTVHIPLTLEERADAIAGEPVRFSGYAAVFNSPSERLWDPRNGDFVETISPGAFTRSLSRGGDVRMYLNHNSDMVLASTRSETMILTEDSRGLRVDATLPDTSYAQDLANLMRSGVVDSMSFGFSVPSGGDTWEGDQRTLTEIALSEVSVVTGFPAYADTAGASVRAVEPEPVEEIIVEQEPVGMPLALARRIQELQSKKG